MIYLVTEQAQLFSSTRFKTISVADSKAIIAKMKIRGLDTETTGLDPHLKELLSVQIGNRDDQIVIDCTTIPIEAYKEILEEPTLYILANAKFDIQFFFKHNIILKNVWDVMLAEQVLNLGYPKGMFHADLKTLEAKYLHKDMDKSVRGKITKVGLTEEVIVYAANDVVDLEDLMNEQKKALDKEDLVTAVRLENRFVLPLAYMEWCGMKLDVDRWKAKMAKDKAKVDKAKKELEDFIIKGSDSNPLFKQFITINRQGDLFSGFDLSPKVTINWNSSKQVISFFKLLGICTKDKDNKDSIDSKILKPQVNQFPILKEYLKYKEAFKQHSTYGQNFLDQLDSNNRIHTKFHQLGTDTARISSGGKDKKAKKEYINFLNLPADYETRACFIAEKGNKWLSIDYSGKN